MHILSTFPSQSVGLALLWALSTGAAAATAAVAVAAADPIITAQELIDRGAVRVPVDAVKALLAAGARIETIAPTSGNTQLWTNEPSGNFIASSKGKLGATSTAQGTWKVTDDGLYCVEIAWKGGGEQWCHAVYLLDSATYLAPADLTKNADKQYGMLTVGGQAGTSAVPVSKASAGTAATRGVRRYLDKAQVEQTFIGKSMSYTSGNEMIQWELRAKDAGDPVAAATADHAHGRATAASAGSLV